MKKTEILMDSVKTTAIAPYEHEIPLFATAAVISAAVWLGGLYASHGVILAFIPGFYILYLFAQSRFVSYLKGTGALATADQFPEIEVAVQECAMRVGLKKRPDVYILHMNGMFNAFALGFLRKTYVVLLSDIVDALEEHPDSLRFYIGHEMGHIRRNHMLWEVVLLPALILPILGAAYSRAREYTCDKYGHACCQKPESSKLGLAALAVGGKKYKVLNGDAYMNQLKATKGFWMSFHELISNYPWLVKRYARVGSERGVEEKIPNRNPLAYIFAIFVPRLSIISLMIIYIAFVVGLGVMKGNELQAGGGSQEYSSGTYDDAPMYEAGEVYDFDGESFEFLGGDPAQSTSWKPFVSPDTPEEELQDAPAPESDDVKPQ
jgi:Zn-dependent protease with chaperone function